jgi:hypothetical protein
MICAGCGREVAVDDRFCAQCGAPQSTAGTVIQPGAESGVTTEPELSEGQSGTDFEENPDTDAAAARANSARSDQPPSAATPPNSSGAGWAATSQRAQADFSISSRTGIDLAGKPLELWLPIVLFTAAGIYLSQLALRALPDSFRLFHYDFVSKSLVLALIILLLVLVALGVGLLALSWLMHRGDRVGRGLAYVAVAALAGIVIFGDGTTTGEVLIMFGGLVAAAILLFAPAVQEVFEAGPQRDQPTSIIVARVALAIWLAELAVGAVVNFCLASLGAKYVFYGLVLAAIAVGGLLLFMRLALADPRARIIVTGAAAVALLFLLLGRHDSGFALLVGLTLSIPACLWLPPDARAFYGDQPLITVGQSA